MNDRELLEQAAAKAGVDLSLWDNLEPTFPENFRYWAATDDAGRSQWRTHASKAKQAFLERLFNPLEEDAHAFRLVIDLGITIQRDGDLVRANDVSEPVGDDPYAAARRAIVNAAVQNP